MTTRSQHHYLPSFDGTKLYVEEYQNHPHPVIDVVLVHGLTGDTSAYSWIIRDLLNHSQVPLRIITFDLRGHGWSEIAFPKTEADLVTVLAKDLLTVCQALVTRPLVLAGQSLFGLIAQSYLEQDNHIEPKSLVLISPVVATPPLSVNRHWWWRVLCTVAHQLPAHTHKRTEADHLAHLGSFDYSPQRIYSDIRFTGWREYSLLWLALFGQAITNLKPLNKPTTHYVYGLQDWVVPAPIQRRTLKQLPLAISYPVPTNHNAIVNNPEKIGFILREVCANLATSLTS